ncbi:cytochrome b5 domain-containing protein [Geopsychrobacter electrodiphilus]|uniref:cytochrome b5 domain-containing protein n=1 Tax=Geopsychrobacter electrodiphilus TaxID=225196 RepID=UPI00036CC194|nr:cytochrome b5 domain-containing protein [Geopsychrobacter electrodiphilus]
MTTEQLAQYTGKNGQPAYVAVGGTVYDVSASPMWQDGLHANTHQAGCDLTEALKSAPHIGALIERFPSVGQLETQRPQPTSRNSKLLLAGAVATAIALAWFFLR